MHYWNVKAMRGALLECERGRGITHLHGSEHYIEERRGFAGVAEVRRYDLLVQRLAARGNGVQTLTTVRCTRTLTLNPNPNPNPNPKP